MNIVLDHLDAVLLDNAYNSASRLVATLCTNRTNLSWPHSSRFPNIIDNTKSNQQLCALVTNRGLWQRDGLYRQSLSIFLVTFLSSLLFYLLFGTACYYRNFDRSLKKQPKFRPNQIRSEIVASVWVLLILNALTAPIFVAQVQGLARIHAFGTGSVWYEVAQYPLFVLFSDTCMYWLHRAFHHPVLFKLSHHKHHK